MKNKKTILTSLILFIILILFFLIRLLSHTEIDDISPQIDCNNYYLEKADVIWVIPEFNKIPISENKTWCEKILSLNKTIGLHGINHNYQEFNQDISENDLQKAIKIFEDCFNQTPKIFKSPQLETSEKNKLLLEKYNLTLEGRTNQIFHKVYHCEDKSGISKGLFPNWIINLF